MIMRLLPNGEIVKMRQCYIKSFKSVDNITVHSGHVDINLTLSRRVTHQCVIHSLSLLTTLLSTQCRGNISSRVSSNSEAFASLY